MPDPGPAGTAAGPARRVPGLARRVLRRARRELSGLVTTTIRADGPDAVRVAVRVAGWPWPAPGGRRHRLDDPHTRPRVHPGRLRLLLPEPAALARLAASGLLAGEVRRLDLRLAAAPEWLRAGVRPPALDRTCRWFRWRVRGRGLRVGIGWARPYDLDRALPAVLGSVLRARPWDQTSGPVYALDRAAWLDGGSSWPQGRLAGTPPRTERDSQGRPLGPYLPAEKPAGTLSAPVLTAVANPYGRRLVGAAARYRLAGDERALVLRDPAGRVVLRFDPAAGPEAGLLSAPGGGFAKYAVASVDTPLPGGDFAVGVVRALAACGVVFAATDPAVRAGLEAAGAVCVAHPDEVTDLRGYALSVAAARRAAVTGDAALRRTVLAGDGAVPLPAVSVVLASMREQHIAACLDYLAAQTYPALEVVVGLHGYELPPATRQRWAERLPFRLRVSTFPAELPFGAVLGRLSRTADGELLTKVDDDDHYGPHHVTDLVVAWHTSGADLVAKGARFVHLAERDQTIDRAWAAPEGFDVTPAGGTMLLSRGTLARVGGWSHSSRHVDADLLARIRSAGGLMYRTHAMEYVYVRRGSGHTFDTATERLLAHGERTYPGLPEDILRPAPAAGD